MFKEITRLVNVASFPVSMPGATGLVMPGAFDADRRIVELAREAAACAEAEIAAFQKKSADEHKAESRQNADSVFMAFHGFYGSMFSSKFATGQLEKGMDVGVLNAKRTWAWGLRAFSNATVKRALDSILSDPASKFKSQIPHLGEFCALCREFAPVATHKREEPTTLAIGMGQKLRSERAARNREIVERHRYKPTPETFGRAAADAVPGLDVLKAVIAQAVGLAGGNEAKKLHEFDVMFAPRGAGVAAGRGVAA